jgi:Tfp pilus assembly protein FimT
MMIVLALISLLVVIASPTFVKMMRDRRVARAAGTVVDYMRQARTLAIGRGQPHLFTWDSAKNGGHLEVDEPIVTSAFAAPTCGTAGWNTTSVQPVTGAQFNLVNYEYTTMGFFDEAGKSQGAVDICFSVTGRMYIRTGSSQPLSGAFTPVLGVPYFSVAYFESASGVTGVTRTVYLMPNGVARMQM